MGKMVGIAEFKANCTRLLREMERYIHHRVMFGIDE